MESDTLKDFLMAGVAVYGAGLSTYIFVTNKPRYELNYSMGIFAAPSDRKGVSFEPLEFVFIKIINTGRVPIYIGKYGFVDETKKFLSVEEVDSHLVRENRHVQVRYEENKISEFAPTNERIALVSDDREVKPHATSIVFFHAKSLRSAIDRSGAKEVSMCVECGKVRKVVKIDQDELQKLDWVGKADRKV
ncbi:MAG: hypothetical protein IKE45_15395 [Halomonas sp.]|nr:hypothetical protein [Halomonas sp.]MBR2515367.1 hypothetical protein [Halomonas sp.]